MGCREDSCASPALMPRAGRGRRAGRAEPNATDGSGRRSRLKPRFQRASIVRPADFRSRERPGGRHPLAPWKVPGLVRALSNSMSHRMFGAARPWPDGYGRAIAQGRVQRWRRTCRRRRARCVTAITLRFQRSESDVAPFAAGASPIGARKAFDMDCDRESDRERRLPGGRSAFATARPSSR